MLLKIPEAEGTSNQYQQTHKVQGAMAQKCHTGLQGKRGQVQLGLYLLAKAVEPCYTVTSIIL